MSIATLVTPAAGLTTLTLAFVLAGVAAAATAKEAAASRLSIGYCTSDLAKAKTAGFDYAEIGIRDFVKLSDEEFAALAAAHDAAALPTSAGFTFLPADLKVVGPAVDRPRVLAYVKKALERSERLGVHIIVFGAPDARRAPDGFSKDEAFTQLVRLGKEIAPLAAKHGITIAAEAICSAQTNMINTTAETMAWVDAVGHPNFQFMVDLYHLVQQGEDPALLRKAHPHIAYAKIANPQGRVFPMPTDSYAYGPYLKVLRELGYQGALGMETPPLDFEKEGPKAIAFLRQEWAAAEAGKHDATH
jgi:D-psicose/D-tagatose/L-ribulose 3-epimerase